MAMCPMVDGVTPHVGGVVTPATTVPTVLIGGVPAAVSGIPAGIVCASPAPNGIAMGSVTVLIGGMPAARVGDQVVEAGAPNPIAMGEPTVLIGG
jgi:uncharacterized Zn-binding protein involved in type VI secretion